MYTQPQKRFRAQKLEIVAAEIDKAIAVGLPVKRVFLADGDAMSLPFNRLEQLCIMIKQKLPSVTRISSYCLPRNLTNKTPEQLARLRELGLSLLYVGCESGDDEVLTRIEKGETFASSLLALQKIKAAGIKASVMILNGLGGRQLSEQHAINSAKLMNQAQPEYLSTLVVSLPLGQQRMDQGFDGQFQLPDQHGLFSEMRLLMANLELERTIFRSDHASNYLVLKGTLGRDKSRLLAEIDQALLQPNTVSLRQEWQRGL